MNLSLAGWSLHRQFMRNHQPLKLLDFPQVARRRFGIDAIELNSPFFESTTDHYLRELKKRARDEGVAILNIAVDEHDDMCAEGWAAARAVNAYAWWIPVAAALGCTAIRANSGGGAIKRFTRRNLEACGRNFAALAGRARPCRIRILMENHWGLSSDPERMLQVRQFSGNAFDFLPDFGNWPPHIERYSALARLMPHAHAVHAKAGDIDARGRHPAFDLGRCVQIAKAAGYDGFLGVEYEGKGDENTNVKRAIRELKKYI